MWSLYVATLTWVGAHGTLADGSPVVGPVWPKLHRGCGGQWCFGSAPSRWGGGGLGRRHAGPVVCFTLALPPQISFEQRVLGLNTSL